MIPRVVRSFRMLGGWFRSHPAVCAAAVYALLSVLFVGQGLLPGRTLSGSDTLWSFSPWAGSRPQGVPSLGSNYEQSDAAIQFQMFLQHTRAELPHIPLWNSHIMGGRSFVASPQTAILSPFSLPAYVLPFWSSLALIAMMKLFTAAYGTYLLGRALRMRFGGALLAGLAYGFSLFLVSWLPWPRDNVFTLVPWLLLLVVLLARQPTILTTVGLAAVVAIQFFGGMPETSGPLLTTTVLLFAYLVVRENGPRGLWSKATLCFGLGLLGGAALAAVTLIPFIPELFRSYDYHYRSGFPVEPVPAHYLLGFFLPDYWGRTPYTVKPFETYMVDRAIYPGALTIMLLGAAAVLRPTRTRLVIALGALLAVGVVVGLEPLQDLWSTLPVLRTAHVNNLTMFFALPVALLAGWGLDELSETQLGPAPRRRWVAGLAGAVLVAPGVWMALKGTLSLPVVGSLTRHELSSALDLAWGSVSPHAARIPDAGVEVIRLAALLEWIVPAVAGLALVVLRLRGSLRGQAFVAMAVALLAVDLWHVGHGVNPVIDKAEAVQPATPAIKYLQGRRPARFVGLSAGFVQALPPNLSMRYHLYDARAYDAPTDLRYSRFWNDNVVPVLPTTPLLAPSRPTAGTVRALGLLSVTDLLQDRGAKPLRLPGLRLAYKGPDARVYANDRALPRAFLVESQQVVRGGSEALAAVSSAGFDGRRVAVTERELPGLSRSPAATAGKSPRAHLSSYDDERVVVHVAPQRPSLLVLTDTYDRGWSARVDGRPAAVHRVNYILRGVLVPPGSHDVEFRYGAPGWRAGWIISLTSTIVLVIFAGIGWRRRRAATRGRGTGMAEKRS